MSEGKRVMLAAADTFRAAAADQLEIWAQRAGADIVRHGEGADPGAVVFDAVAAAKARGCDVIIIDTAGRLHVDGDLMAELQRIKENVQVDETLLVIDAMAGQDAVNVAKSFSESTGLDGVILTKLDGTAKGGIAVAIQSELGIPVKYVGIGEKIDDLQKFDANDFVNALFKRNEALTENE